MRSWLAVVLVPALALAGCVADPPSPRGEAARPADSPSEQDLEEPSPAPMPSEVEPPTSVPETIAPEPSPPPPPQRLDLGDVPEWPPLVWDGDCPCLDLVARVPAFGGPDAADAWLDVRVLWDGTQSADVGLEVTPPGGDAIAGLRGFDERRVQVASAAPGEYGIRVQGTGHVQLRLALETLDGPGSAAGPDRLPNLVTMRPQDFHIGGCDEVETIEQGATRCLRFGNGIGNTGNGPLQVRLTFPQSALAPAGQGRFVQEVLQADGSFAAHDVSLARFHPTHGHWHYDGVVHYALHAVDPATGLRLEEVASHHKAGFCLLDWDMMDATDTEPWTANHAEQSCLVPWIDGWTMGVTPGWYDFYWSGLTDQYVDVAGIPDGLYEFVSTADGIQSLAEWDESDNAASVLLTLEGNTVEVVEARAYYQVQPADQS